MAAAIDHRCRISPPARWPTGSAKAAPQSAPAPAPGARRAGAKWNLLDARRGSTVRDHGATPRTLTCRARIVFALPGVLKRSAACRIRMADLQDAANSACCVSKCEAAVLRLSDCCGCSGFADQRLLRSGVCRLAVPTSWQPGCIEWGSRQPAIAAAGFGHIADVGSATEGLESCPACCNVTGPTPERLQERGATPRDDEPHWRDQRSAPASLDRRFHAPRQRAVLPASRHA